MTDSTPASTAIRMPYSRQWIDGERVDNNVNPHVADERQEPRGLAGCRVLYFAMVDEAPDGGIVIDDRGREVALLMEQAAGWLRMNPYETVLGLSIQHPNEGERTRLLMVVES